MRKTILVILLTISPLYVILWGQIVNIEDKRSSKTDTTTWHETLDLGFNWIKNNSNIFNFSGAAQIEFQDKTRMFLSITNFKYVVIDDQHFVNEGFQHLRYNNAFRKKLTFEIFAQAQFNEQLNLKLRALAGTGLRYTLLNKTKAKAFLGASIMYEYDEESNGLIHHDQRLSSYLSCAVTLHENIRLASTTYYQPLFTNFNDLRLSTKTTIEYTISKKLKLTSNFTLTYDSRAPEGSVKEAHQLTGGLRYIF